MEQKAPKNLIPRKKVNFSNMPPDELSEKTNKVLEQRNLPFLIQARIGALVSEKVIGSKNPRLKSLQPHFVATDNSSWDDAFLICLAFLKHYKMETTLKTINNEFNLQNIPHEHQLIFTPDLAETYLNDLISIRDKKITFEQKLKSFHTNIQFDDALQDSPLKSCSVSSRPFSHN